VPVTSQFVSRGKDAFLQIIERMVGFFPALGEIPKLQELFATMGEAAQRAGRDPNRLELSCMARAAVDSVKALEDIGISRVVVAPPAFDKEGLSRGLEKIGSEVIARV